MKATSRAGSPLNIQAALDEAGDIIFEQFGIDRTLSSLTQRWYKYLCKKHTVWGMRNIKSLPRSGDDKIVPIEVTLKGKKYLLTVNLTAL